MMPNMYFINVCGFEFFMQAPKALIFVHFEKLVKTKLYMDTKCLSGSARQ